MERSRWKSTALQRRSCRTSCVAYTGDWAGFKTLFPARLGGITEQKLGRIGSVMEALSVSLRDIPLQQTLLELTNMVSRELKASRVAIGLTERAAIRVQAISDAAWFEQNTEAVKHYVAATEETLDQLAPVHYIKSEAPSGSPPEATSSATAHAAPSPVRLARSPS